MILRRTRSFIILGMSATAAILSAGLLFLILGILVYRGATAVTLEFITQPASDFGHAGGILYQIIGTLLLVGGAAAVSLPLSLCTAVYHTEYLQAGWKRKASVLLYGLNGVPTILFGLFGYLVFGIYFGWGVSWLTGSMILGLMIIPTATVCVKEAVEAIPAKYREAGMALGLTRWQMIRSVILPQSLYGIVTGLLLGLARAAGETAAILFTATTFWGVGLPHSLFEPVTSLQTHIFILSQEAQDPVAQGKAWGAALVLVVIVLLLNTGSLLVRGRLSWEGDH